MQCITFLVLETPWLFGPDGGLHKISNVEDYCRRTADEVRLFEHEAEAIMHRENNAIASFRSQKRVC